MQRLAFMEYMNESKPLNRWFVLRIGIIGAFCGSLLTLTYLMVIAAN